MSGGDYRRRGFDRKDSKISKKQKLILSAEEKLESKLGYDLFTEGDKRLGWLLTFSSVSIDITYTHFVYLHFCFSSNWNSSIWPKIKLIESFYIAPQYVYGCNSVCALLFRSN